jgi:hypothetical protein
VCSISPSLLGTTNHVFCSVGHGRISQHTGSSLVASLSVAICSAAQPDLSCYKLHMLNDVLQQPLVLQHHYLCIHTHQPLTSTLMIRFATDTHMSDLPYAQAMSRPNPLLQTPCIHMSWLSNPVPFPPSSTGNCIKANYKVFLTPLPPQHIVLSIRGSIESEGPVLHGAIRDM